MPDSEPETKKLRSCEDDLKVVLGDGAPSEDNVRWYNSAILASKSAYIDAMLATPMKESKERQITFPDITPRVWETMLTFVNDPKAARKMTMADALDVLKMYDKYQFQGGKDLCEDVMEEYFKEVRENENEVPPDVDAMVEGTALAFEANLTRALEAGSDYIKARLCRSSVPYGRTMFTEEHIERLVPLLMHLKKNRCIPNYWLNDSLEDMKKPDFPTRYVQMCKQHITENTLYGFIDRIELSDTHGEPDGFYSMSAWSYSEYVRVDGATMTWGGTEVEIVIKKTKNGWAILRKTLPALDEHGQEDESTIVTSVCWLHPCSQNLPLPPMSGWRAVDKACHDRHTPKIKYRLKKYGEMSGDH